MKKSTTDQVMRLYAECLRQLYDAAGLTLPKEFDADLESARIASALVSKGLGIKP